MKKNGKVKRHNSLRSEYDFTKLNGGLKGKYFRKYRKGNNLALLAPDVAQAFPNDKAVNDALRLLMSVARGKLRRVG